MSKAIAIVGVKSMDIFLVDRNKTKQFEDILPVIPAPRLVKVIGAQIDGKPCASLVFEIMDGIFHISWIYVHPDYRRQGIGTQLLGVVCDFTHQKTDKNVTMTYKTGNEYTKVLDHMLQSKGFELTRHRVLSYSVTKEELLQLSFCRSSLSVKNGKSTICSIGELSVIQLKEMISQNEKSSNYLVSRADYLNIDSSRSKVLLQNKEVKGLVLLESTEREGVMQMSVLYIAPDCNDVKMLGALLQEAIFSAIQPPTSMQTLEFHCINEKSEKLAKYLFPDSNPRNEWVAYGIMR